MKEKLIHLIPGIEGEELVYVHNITKGISDEQLSTFAAIYNGRRKKSETILIATALGLLGIGGIQRFLLNQVGMGILFLLTIGLCYIGTIIDIVNYKRLTFEYNQNAANESLRLAMY
jgi:TM2 domain-containing membrane protein YozV